MSARMCERLFGVSGDMEQLVGFLDLWFGPPGHDVVDPAKAVGRLLRFNRPVADWFDGDVEVVVVEQQGVWLWGRTEDGRYVERSSQPRTKPPSMAMTLCPVSVQASINGPQLMQQS